MSCSNFALVPAVRLIELVLLITYYSDVRIYDSIILKLNEKIHLNYYQGLRCSMLNVSP